MAEGTLHCRIIPRNIYGNQRCRNADNGNIAAQLLIFPHILKILHQHQIEQVEVHPEQQHKCRNDIFKIRTIVFRNAAIFYRKAACPCCRKGMHHAVKKGHSTCKQQNHLHQCQYNINRIQDFCCRFYLWHQLGNQRSGCLRLHQIHRALVPKGHNCKHKYQNPHTANPMRKATPELNTFRQSFNLLQNACARCGKAGYRFKKAIYIARNRAAQIKRQCPQNGHHNPRKCNHNEALSPINPLIFRLTADQNRPYHQAGDNGCDKCRCRLCLLIPYRNKGRHCKQGSLYSYDIAQNIGNHIKIHNPSPNFNLLF